MAENNNNNNEQHYHEYDGIIEHNNPMPGWWLWTFILCVIFAFIYYIHYEIAGGPTLQDELKESMAQIEALKSAAGATGASLSEQDVLASLKDPQSLNAGSAVFAAKCAVCHGDHLEGKIGPNLTDKFWIHGKGKATDIVGVVKEGVPAKGMPPWGGLLKDDEIKNVVAFVLSKKNSQPANAKAAEGAEVPDYF